MSNLLDNILNPDYYIKLFNTWEASEFKLDENRTIYQLKAPDSEYQKVSLFTDGYFMCVYGDYGTMTFNQMTWKGNVFNLHYDNIGYQMEKLSHESKDVLRVYDETKCSEDILDWLKDRLEYHYDIDEELIQKVFDFCSQDSYIWKNDISDFCEANDCDDIKEIMEFTLNALKNTDEYEWISFLGGSSELRDFDEVCECDLWHAGKCVHQRYFINMLALRICGEKLKEINND